MSSDIPNTNVSFSSMRDAYNNTFDSLIIGSVSLSDFRNAQLSGNVIVPTSGISLGNIRNKNFTIGYFLEGNSSTGIRFPSTIIPSNFTILSVSRYHPASTRTNQERIFDAQTGNWLHAHWDSHSGVAHYGAWKTASTSASGYVKNKWLTFCGTNQLQANAPPDTFCTINGTTNIGGGGGGGGTSRHLSINHGGTYNGSESSHWQVREFIIWNTHLSLSEAKTAIDIVNAETIPAQNPSWPKSGNILCWFHASTFPSASSTNANWSNSQGSLGAGNVSRGTVTRVEKKRYKNARKVKVKQDSSSNMYMNISEVRVFGISGYNIANTSTATHSSTYNSWPASRAIDGNTSTSTHTNSVKNNWLLLTFPNNVVIDYIEIVNRSGYLNGDRTPTSIELLDSSDNVLFSQNFGYWPEQTKYVEIY